MTTQDYRKPQKNTSDCKSPGLLLASCCKASLTGFKCAVPTSSGQFGSHQLGWWKVSCFTMFHKPWLPSREEIWPRLGSPNSQVKHVNISQIITSIQDPFGADACFQDYQSSFTFDKEDPKCRAQACSHHC